MAFEGFYTQDTLLIFCHGIGGGNRSYLTEIHTLCKAEKKAYYANADWRRMTAQDPEFWHFVENFLSQNPKKLHLYK